jgi:hypothetical protein
VLNVQAVWAIELLKLVQILSWDQIEHPMGLDSLELAALDDLANPLPSESESLAGFRNRIEILN